MSTPALTVVELRTYLSDLPECNLLLDKEEFGNVQLKLAIDLAISEFNLTAPVTAFTLETFPLRYKSLLMSGALYKLFLGASALSARNTLSYSDGGLQVPIEEKFAMYQSLAQMFQADFTAQTRLLKNQMNYESGWGYVSSDAAHLPGW